MAELICHLFGDFVLQRHDMAVNKTRSSLVCLLHVLFYTLPFLFLTDSYGALAFIAGTHFVIDRFALAKRWPAFWGVGCEGWVVRKLRERRARPAPCDDRCLRCVTGVVGSVAGDPGVVRLHLAGPPEAPEYLAVWLAIIVDNTFHLLLNHLALAHL